MSGILRRAAALAAASAAFAPAAGAATVSAPAAIDRDCAQALFREHDPGSTSRAWTAPADGYLTVSLGGGRTPDWDLALFALPGREPLGASTSFTSNETLTWWAHRGERFAIQACRGEGDQASLPLEVDFQAIPLREREEERISIESVPLSGPEDLAALERLGVDVTHDISATEASVVAYNDAERALLRRRFGALTEVPNLVAQDAADRAAEQRAAADGVRSDLPSGRDTYRQYADYTTELQALAAANPGLVRSITIGTTLEGRPIEGVEIAIDVERTDDGRPVFLNFGAHHAREWPSAELPMEFALDVVERFNAGDPRVVDLLGRVRMVIVPVVNVDGFLASRSWGTSMTDDDPNANLAAIINDQGAYKRKNCRLTVGPDIPCRLRSNSGVDLNRNFGAYWGGPGSSSDPTTQSYRGTGPFSEPESQAVHNYTASIHPTVFVTNHTFTEDGKWLRQPGFDAPFLPQTLVPTYDDLCPANEGDMGAITPDEAAMKALGDSMAAATGWTSELGYETLCDITGATEDWNYFSQGTYGYTPEIRGLNFHANYADSVVGEYLGEGPEAGLGAGEAYLRAAEIAADRAHHGVIAGTAPPGATLTLRKQFSTATCDGAACDDGNGPPIADTLETTLTVPASGSYEWDVNPSGRPLAPGETWSMTCRADAGESASREVAVARGQRVTVDWAQECATPDGGGGTDLRCAGRPATVTGTKADDRLTGTRGADVFAGRGGEDRIRGRGGNDRICGQGGADDLGGGGGADRIRGGNGKDRIVGGPGRDRCSGGKARDKIRGCG